MNLRNPDEIKRGLECCSEDGCKECPYEQDCNMADGFSVLAADALTYIQQLEDHLRENTKMVERLESQVPKWISVEERLPEKGERVLVTNGPEGGFVCESYLNINSKWMRAGCELVFMTPHYWMPLPKPPEEG